MPDVPERASEVTAANVERPHSTLHRVSSAFARFARASFLRVPQAAAAQPSVHDGPIPDEELLKKALVALQLSGKERVLELGSNTGYETALLSHLAHHVVSLVGDDERAADRTKLLQSLGCHNVEVVAGYGRAGWPAAAPYSAILVASGASHVPAPLLDQLENDGRLVIPLGDESGQLLELLRHRPDGYPSQTLTSCKLPMLPWASRPPSSFPWGGRGPGGRPSPEDGPHKPR